MVDGLNKNTISATMIIYIFQLDNKQTSKWQHSEKVTHKIRSGPRQSGTNKNNSSDFKTVVNTMWAEDEGKSYLQ